MSVMRKIFTLLMILTLGLLTGCGGNDSANAPREHFLHIATGNTAGTYYPIGGAISEILSTKIEKMHSGVQTTSGSIANLRLLADGTVEMAIIQNDIAYYAVNGTEMFKDDNKYKFDTLRGLMSLYQESCQVVTRAEAGINSVADLKGKKVSVGVEGSGVEANARQILEAYGLSYSDIEPVHLSFASSDKALQEGSIDAAFFTAGAPTNAISNAAANIQIKILDIDDEHFKQLHEKYPFYTRSVIAAGTYNNQPEAVQTIGVMAILACNDSINADLGYKIAKTICENLTTFRDAHPVVAKFDKAHVGDGMTITFNEGAEKFFKE